MRVAEGMLLTCWKHLWPLHAGACVSGSVETGGSQDRTHPWVAGISPEIQTSTLPVVALQLR